MTSSSYQLLVSCWQTCCRCLPEQGFCWDWRGVQSLYCMLLNPSKTKSFVVNRSRTLTLHMVSSFLLGFLSGFVQTIDILGVRFDSKLIFEAHVLRTIVYFVSQRICILWLMRSVIDDSSLLLPSYDVCVLLIFQNCSPVTGSLAECYFWLHERQALLCFLSAWSDACTFGPSTSGGRAVYVIQGIL